MTPAGNGIRWHKDVANWVFVTGAPRSGTTFAGRMLSPFPRVDYIHEPFNPDCGIPGLDRRFLYLRAGERALVDEGSAEELIARIFRYDFRLRTGLFAKDTKAKKLLKRVTGSRGPVHLRVVKANPKTCDHVCCTD